MESYKYDYDQHIIPAESRVSSGKEDDRRLSLSSNGLLKNLRKLVAVTAAALTVSGPLLVGMGVTLALTVSLAVIGLPLMLIFSPLLIFPTFIVVTAVAGFSVSALLALAGITTLNWVFQSIRRQYQMHDDDDKTVGKAAAMNEEEAMTEEEEDSAAKMLARGWKSEHEQKQQDQSQKQQPQQQQQDQGQKQQSQQQQQQNQGQKPQQQNPSEQPQQQQQQNQGQKPQQQNPSLQPQQQQQQNQGQKQEKETGGENEKERGGVRGSDAASTEETAEKGDTKEGKSEKQQEEDITDDYHKSATTTTADTSEKSVPKSKRPTTKPKK